MITGDQTPLAWATSVLRRTYRRKKVFGIGWHKTGTKTLGRCLEVLGYHHAGYDFSLLQDYFDGDVRRIFAIADRYTGFDDWPWPFMFRELERRYPDALFILTTRKDPETWFKSLKHHAAKTGPQEPRQLIYGHPMPKGHSDQHIAIYIAHNRNVQNYFKNRPGKLLEVCWETGAGWEDLCGFLKHPLPEGPFPHENKGAASEQSG